MVRPPGHSPAHISAPPKKKSVKNSRHGAEQILRVTQTHKNGYPFVIAGRYSVATLAAGQEKVNLWTRLPQNSDVLRQPSEALVRAIQAYDSTFGARPEDSHQLWIGGFPDLQGCLPHSTPS